jgi:calmodulin
VACGGNSDCTGNIEREALIKIVKEDFGLTIDIQSLIEKFENDAGQLSYEECVDFSFKTCTASCFPLLSP